MNKRITRIAKIFSDTRSFASSFANPFTAAIVGGCIILAIVTKTLPASAERGGWVFSGGEIFRFAKNPWFVKNTQTVSYCYKVDTASISAPVSFVKEAFQDALAYWKAELAATQNPSVGFAAIGTQAFVEHSTCTAQTDLKVILGEGALAGELSPDDFKSFGDPRRFLGVSVRTDYDLESLKAQGFIYISSDIGPRAYDTLPLTDHLVSKAWDNKIFLTYAFMHELGHVFGVPHTGSGLMSEVFLDQLLHKRFSNYYLNNPVERFLTPPLNFEICTLNGSFHANFFEVPLDTKCLKLEGSMTGALIEWKVYSMRTPTSPPEFAGTFRVKRSAQTAASAKPAAVVHLPPEQKVFTAQERFMNTFLIGPIFDEGSAEGTFTRKATHRPHEVQLQLQSDAVTIMGLVSGKMVQVLVYSPPTLLKNIFPIEIK